MKRRSSFAVSSVAFSLVTGFVSLAGAQGSMTPSQPPPVPPAEPAPTPTQPPVVQRATPAPASTASASASASNDGSNDGPLEKPEAPPARTGFQLGLRTGVQVPLGEVDKGESMSDSFTPQWPLVADIGVKVLPSLFLGGYLGISVGGVGDAIKKSCDVVGVDCMAVGFRFGIEAQFSFNPEGRWNPWIGYGIGYEIAGASGSKNGNKLTAALGGVEFAHLMAGADYRINKTVGIGPTADFAIGQYSIASVEGTRNGVTSKTDGDIKNTALHQWLLLGVRSRSSRERASPHGDVRQLAANTARSRPSRASSPSFRAATDLPWKSHKDCATTSRTDLAPPRQPYSVSTSVGSASSTSRVAASRSCSITCSAA